MEKAGEARGRSVFRQPARGHRDRASVCVVDLKAEIDKLATEYMSSARSLSSEEKLALLKQIQEAYGKCKEFGDDKVQLAMQTYEMVGPCSWLLTFLPSNPRGSGPILSLSGKWLGERVWASCKVCSCLLILPEPASTSPFSFLSTQVDKHIRRLDTDLARFEADLKEKQIESSDYDSSSSKGKKSEEGGWGL